MNIFQNVTKGSFVKGGAMLIVLVAAQGPYAAKWGVFGFFLTGVPLWCFGVLASVGGILFFLWPMIYGSDTIMPAEQPSKKTEKMLVLYLRAFELDARNILQLIVGASAGALVYTGLIDGVWWVLAFVPLFINISKEQTFKDALESLGEFITFGKPGEALRPIGASRVYAGKNWQQEIMKYITRARLVIVRPGKGDSIEWEIDQVLRKVPPERILFYLRFRGRKQKREEAYKKFRDLAHNACPAILPEQPQEFPYLIFDSSWNPYFIREANRPAELVRQIISPSGDVVIDRWRPILNALNIDIPSQSNNWVSKAVTVFMWLMLLLAVGLVIWVVLIAMSRTFSALALSLLITNSFRSLTSTQI
jgi:hypothetical protein